jgi:hypothetical protein
VSDLAARGARHPWTVNAGLITMGLSIAALGPALLGTLPRGRLRAIAAALFVLAGVAFARERGFGIAPFWLTVPLGPLRWPLRCREQSRFESDGTFVETFHLRSLGLPAGRMTFRVRPEGAD